MAISNLEPRPARLDVRNWDHPYEIGEAIEGFRRACVLASRRSISTSDPTRPGRRHTAGRAWSQAAWARLKSDCSHSVPKDLDALARGTM
jgi:hypothetical protein